MPNILELLAIPIIFCILWLLWSIHNHTKKYRAFRKEFIYIYTRLYANNPNEGEIAEGWDYFIYSSQPPTIRQIVERVGSLGE